MALVSILRRHFIPFPVGQHYWETHSRGCLQSRLTWEGRDDDPNACECTPSKGKQLSFNSRCHRAQLDHSCHFPFQFSGLFVCFFPPYHTTSRISFPWLGIDPTPLAVKAQSPNLWRAREFTITQLFYIYTTKKFSSYCPVPQLFSLPWKHRVLTSGEPGNSP